MCLACLRWVTTIFYRKAQISINKTPYQNDAKLIRSRKECQIWIEITLTYYWDNNSVMVDRETESWLILKIWQFPWRYLQQWHCRVYINSSIQLAHTLWLTSWFKWHMNKHACLTLAKVARHNEVDIAQGLHDRLSSSEIWKDMLQCRGLFQKFRVSRMANLLPRYRNLKLNDAIV